MDRCKDLLARLLEEYRPVDAWGLWTDLALVLYALQKDKEILLAAEQCAPWDMLVHHCAQRIQDLPLYSWQPQKNLPAGCILILRDILRILAGDPQALAQNTADLLDGLLQQMFDQLYIRDLIPPRSLADLMAKMALPQGPCRVLDPVCGSGRLLQAARSVNPAASLRGMEARKPIALASQLYLRIWGIEDCDVDDQADIFHPAPYMREETDIVLANPPYESELRFTVRCILAFLEVLRPRGRCAVLVPEGLLNNTSHPDAVTLREYLLRSQRLEAVIFLPMEIYKPYTASHSSLLLLRKDPGRQEVFLGRIPGNRRSEGKALDSAYLPDMDRILQGWNCWSAGKPLPETAADLCWTASWEDIERTEGYIFSAEHYRPSIYIRQAREPGELDQVRRCQRKLEELLSQYTAEQEVRDGM